MYRWRQLTDEQRQHVRKHREESRFPFHSPPHYQSDCGLYLMTASCYEHKPVIGANPDRMLAFENALLGVMQEQCTTLFAWTILPNHYHALIRTGDIKRFLRELGRLHGRCSFKWNGEEKCRNRKVWFSAVETAMKSERHFWATMNYVLHNAVRHGYLERWTDWPYCNAQAYLDSVGREQAKRTWMQ
jgi:putative transposase